MDVRCEKCKTEYEFDDARISEAGVTVKCTSCGHVFKVKKRALVVTVPVRPGEMEPTFGAGSAPADRQREWKVRQASGNLFTFKELTTLQKWIVERKVSRDDEISLTGESWKRLGNIAELASFFQVVEEATRAQSLGAMPGNLTPAGGYVLPSVPAPQALGASPISPSGQFSMPQPMGAPPPAVNVHVTTQSTPEGMRRRPVEPTPMEMVDDMKRAGVRGGGTTVLVVLLVLAALGGGGYYGYFYWWVPQQQKEQELLREKDDAEAKLKAEEAQKAAEEKARKEKEEADARLAAAAKADAGPPDAGELAKKEPAHDFDYYMSRGDRLRESDKPEAALDAYGKAADLQPDRSEAIAGKGLALIDMGDKPQAEAAFKQALNLNPRYGVAIMGLAETYRAMGKKEEAIQYYQKYLDELPDGREASVARNAIENLKQ